MSAVPRVVRAGGAGWFCRGVQISEAAITYSIYVLIITLVVGGAAYVRNALNLRQVVADVRAVAQGVQGAFLTMPDYSGLSIATLANLQILHPGLIASGEVVTGGGNRAVDVFVSEGGLLYTALGAATARRFLLGVGGLDFPVENLGVCVDLVVLRQPGLRAVQVNPVQDGVSVRAVTDPGAGSPAAGAAWMAVPSGLAGSLLEREVAQAQGVCRAVIDAGGGAQVVYVFE